MVSITPFGQNGPQAAYHATDLEIMAASGCMHLVGDPEREPVRVSEPQAAPWTASHAAAGAVIAHYHREVTGRGQHVDVSAQATLLWATVHAPIAWDLNREMQTRGGSKLVGRSVRGTRYRTIWPCKGGYITFTLYGGPAGRRTNQQLTAWMDQFGLAPEWLKTYDWDDFDVNTVAQEEVDHLEAAIAPFFLEITKSEFLEGVVSRDMLGYPLSSVDDLLADPQLEARDFWKQVTYPWLGATLPYPGPLALFSASPLADPRPAPSIGQHNLEVYQGELGLSPLDLARLKAAGVI
jgi:benzylsuccinate CoA-transferase BbsE subunit